jgi:Rrf2 family protein
MKRDSRLSGVLHAILHMAEAAAPLTSEQLAAHMEANPVVIRRIMAGLREAGFVTSSKGHGGGWVLARPLADISLLDVYGAIGAPAPFALGNRNDSPGCLVEQAVNSALDSAFREAEVILIERLGAVTLAQLFEDFHRRFQARKEELSHVSL